MKTGTEVSVIIPSYKSANTLHKCLESVTKQQTSWRYEVIVVHSGPEPVPEEVPLTFSSVDFYMSKTRWLPGRARNWAIKRASSPWIIFLDADCIVDDNWIQTLVSEAVKQDADGIGGSVRNGRPWSLTSWTMHLLEFSEWLPGGKQRICENFPTCNAIYRRSALLKVGGFPENFYPGEDTLLNHLLHCSGYKLMFIPKCTVSHINTRNATDILRHNYAHGFFYGHMCHTYKLPGCFLTHFNRVLISLIVVPVRFIRVILRLIPRHMLLVPLLIVSTPLVLLSLIAWGAGFADANKYPVSKLYVADNGSE